MTNIFIVLLMDLKVQNKTRQVSKITMWMLLYQNNFSWFLFEHAHFLLVVLPQETVLFYSLMATAFHAPVHTALLFHFPPPHCRLCHAFTTSYNAFGKMSHLRKVKVMKYAYPIVAKINLTFCIQFNSTTVMG